MSAHAQVVDVSGDAGYPATPQVVIPFVPKCISVLNEDVGTTDDVYVSFDGVNDMGHLIAGATIEYTLQFVTKVWLRRGAVGTPPTNVQVVAEA